MKKLVKTMSLLTLLFLTTFVNANEIFKNVRVFSNNSKTLNLQLKNNDGITEVFIKDMNGIQLYKEKFTGDQLFKKFDLSLLPNGNYVVEIEGQTKIKVFPFKILGSKVDVLEMKNEIVYKPIVRVQDNLVYISKFSPTNKVIKIAFYDAQNNLLLQDNLTKEIVSGKILDISKILNGNYILTLSYGEDRVSSHKIIK